MFSDVLTVAKIRAMVAQHEGMASLHVHPDRLYDLEGDPAVRAMHEANWATGRFGAEDAFWKNFTDDIGPLVGAKYVRLYCSSQVPREVVRVVDSAGAPHDYVVAEVTA